MEAGPHPGSVALGDLDGDGRLDLVATGALTQEFYVLLGNGDGTFQDARTYTALTTLEVGVADVDADGALDLVVSDYGMGSVGVLLGNGDGTFQAIRNFGARIARSFAIADFNDDGLKDLVVVNGGGAGFVSILINDTIRDAQSTNPASGSTRR